MLGKDVAELGDGDGGRCWVSCGWIGPQSADTGIDCELLFDVCPEETLPTGDCEDNVAELCDRVGGSAEEGGESGRICLWVHRCLRSSDGDKGGETCIGLGGSVIPNAREEHVNLLILYVLYIQDILCIKLTQIYLIGFYESTSIRE